MSEKLSSFGVSKRSKAGFSAVLRDFLADVGARAERRRMFPGARVFIYVTNFT
jgi:hypothetical protein